MELINTTKLLANYTQGLDKSGREHLVVVAKGTFEFPTNGQIAIPSSHQEPLIEADLFTGEPGFSAPSHESDYALIKPRCDILLNGCAHAPGRSAVRQLDVALKVGDVQKTLRVIGDRCWRVTSSGFDVSDPVPFTRMEISYNRAFGGTDRQHPDAELHAIYSANPVGRGYHTQLASEFLDGRPLPNIEQPDRPVVDPRGSYLPGSFGPVGRNWMPRSRLAGTYDQNWLENVFPFLPADFDPAYFQASPVDQQTHYLSGGEPVFLYNLSPAGFAHFYLPRVDVPVVFFHKRGTKIERQAVCDTLMIEPERNLFTLTFRSSIPLEKSIFEIRDVLVGRQSRAWWRARISGKSYYSSLAKAVSGTLEEEF